MPIEYRCPSCSKLLRVPNDAAGRQAKCPACGASTTVPAAETGDSPAHGLPGEAGAQREGPAEYGGPGGGDAGADGINPYQSPTPFATSPGAGAQPAGEVDREYARSRVSAPATWLVVTGALGLPAQAFGIAVNFLQVGGLDLGGGPQDPAFLVFFTGFGLLMAALGIVLSIVVIVGALRMMRLENYGLSIAAAVIAMAPGLSPCCLLGLPFGIWALVVLCDGRVKAAFRR